jgi:RNA polymerase sigma-70 factor (family 1)
MKSATQIDTQHLAEDTVAHVNTSVMDTSTSVSAPDEAVVTDVEVFIRKTFESDPRLGCELLYRHYYQPLCSHAVRLLYSKTIAEDLVSEIFLQFYQKETYKHISTSFRAYLYKAVRHRAYNYLRWESKRTTDLEDFGGLSDTASLQPDAIIQYEELYQCVENAVNSLPSQRRKIYLMHRFEDKKYAEIAEELQLSPRTIEVQIRKASIFLRDELKKRWGSLFSLLVVLFS